MTLLRREAMRRDGDWATWCICEDAEMGLRLMHAGWRSVYVNRCFGRGLTPDSFGGYKGQRFRWAYGAVQILKRHWRWLLLPRDRALSRGQRYHFVVGWAGWMADAMNLVFVAAALAWTAGILALPEFVPYPVSLFLIPTLAVFALKVGTILALYRGRVPCSAGEAMAAALAGLALTYTVGKAVIVGFTTASKPFLRTPKCEDKPALVRGLAQAWEEASIAVLLWAAGLSVGLELGAQDPEAWLWASVLLIQSVPFLASVSVSLIGAAPRLGLAVFRQRVVQAAGE